MNLTTLATYLGPTPRRAPAAHEPLRLVFSAVPAPGGTEPIRLECLAWDQTAKRLRALDLQPGERVEISGTFYAYPQSRGPNGRSLRLQLTLRSVGRVDRAPRPPAGAGPGREVRRALSRVGDGHPT